MMAVKTCKPQTHPIIDSHVLHTPPPFIGIGFNYNQICAKDENRNHLVRRVSAANPCQSPALTGLQVQQLDHNGCYFNEFGHVAAYMADASI